MDKTCGNPEYMVAYVCDGHGGTRVSEMIASNNEKGLQVTFEKCLDEHDNIDTALLKTFEILDMNAKECQTTKKMSAMGSTLCLAVIDIMNSIVHVANCGDSRCALYDHRTKSIFWRSKDHSPSDPKEKKRINDAGGFIIHYRGTPRVQGSLAVSRSIGDHYMKDYIISLPDVTKIELHPYEKISIIIASDGLWHYATEKEVEKSIGTIYEKPPQDISDKLVSMVRERRIIDNTSVIIINCTKSKHVY